MKKSLAFIVFAALLYGCAQSNNSTVIPEGTARNDVSKAWNPDNGDGTYKNPVLNADYSDPDVCAVGDDYYLTASSFNCIPGLPILHSKDLVNWEIIGHGLQKLYPEEVFDKPQHGRGVWAPSIRYHDGLFYIYWGDPDFGIFVVTAKDPAGEWTAPHCVLAGKGMIDTCPLWDDDGRCYLVNGWANSRAGINSVLTVRELSADGMTAIGQPRLAFDGWQENHTAEGPKFYKKDGWYWIFCPAGGVKTGWQLAMRSRNVYGPYEARNVMDQGNTAVNGPHQGGWVHTPQGEDWFLHFNDRYAYGRVVFLQPMIWKDGWPVIGEDPDGDGTGQPVMSFRKPKSGSKTRVNPMEDDEFDGPAGLQWQWHANFDQLYGMATADGVYRMYNYDLPSDNLWDAPNLLLQKLPAGEFTATAKMKVASKCEGEYGGLVMMGQDYQALVAERKGDGFEIQLRTCKGAERGSSAATVCLASLEPTAVDPIPGYSPAIYMEFFVRIKVKDSKCLFSWSLDGQDFKAASEEPFTMKEGRWIGAKMGFVSEARNRTSGKGWLDADWFRVTE